MSIVLLRSLIDGTAEWPTAPNGYGGRSSVPVTIRHGGDVQVWFTPFALRWDDLVARRICAIGGPDAVAADVPTDGMADRYRGRFGEFAACHDLERWYAPFAGSRRRILAVVVPDRVTCHAGLPTEPPPVVTTFDRPVTWEDRRPAVAMASVDDGPRDGYLF